MTKTKEKRELILNSAQNIVHYGKTYVKGSRLTLTDFNKIEQAITRRLIGAPSDPVAYTAWMHKVARSTPIQFIVGAAFPDMTGYTPPTLDIYHHLLGSRPVAVPPADTQG